MNKDEALKMAIEALENIAFEYGQLLDGDQDYGLLPSETNEDIVIAYRVKRACKEALEQPAQGMKAVSYPKDNKWIDMVEQPAFDYNTAFSHGYETHKAEREYPTKEEMLNKIFEATYQQHSAKLMQPNKEFVLLSDDEIEVIDDVTLGDYYKKQDAIDFARAIEAKLKEKNHA